MKNLIKNRPDGWTYIHDIISYLSLLLILSSSASSIYVFVMIIYNFHTYSQLMSRLINQPDYGESFIHLLIAMIIVIVGFSLFIILQSYLDKCFPYELNDDE